MSITSSPNNIYRIEYLKMFFPNMGHLDQQKNADLDKAQLSSNEQVAGPMGFEPTTFSLEG